MPHLPRPPAHRRGLCALRCIVLALVAVTAGICQAGITVYRDRSAFESAVGPVQVETFGETARFPIRSGVLNAATDEIVRIGPPIRPGDLLPGVTYQRPTAIGTPYALNLDTGGTGTVGAFLDGMHGSPYDPGLTTIFDQPVRGFGFETNALMGQRFTVTIDRGNVPWSQSFPITSGNYSFFGFVSGQPDIASALIEGVGSYSFRFVVDNFTTPIPEAPAVAMWGSALSLWAMAGWQRRRQRQSRGTNPLRALPAGAPSAGFNRSNAAA